MSGRGSTLWIEDTIPAELRALQRWLGWRYIERDGRATKVPICARSGGAASATDPTTWCDYPTAASRARTQRCGIGIMLGDGLTGVDLDDCASDTGELTPWAREIVAALGSYTETSPSGRGVHVVVRGVLPVGRRRRDKIEMYDRDRYLCVTGRHLAGTPATVEERTDALAALHRSVFGDAEQPAPQTALNPMRRASDSDLVERAHSARNGGRFGRLWRGDVSGYGSASEADLALCAMLAWHTEDAEQIARLVAQSGLAREKWQRDDYRNRTIAAALASAGARRGAEAERSARTDALVARELGL